MKKAEPKMRWFLCTIAHFEKNILRPGLLTKDEARRMAASLLLKWRWLPFKNCGSFLQLRRIYFAPKKIIDLDLPSGQTYRWLEAVAVPSEHRQRRAETQP
jgi:hypothetical protein